jgi:hypothetical protein
MKWSEFKKEVDAKLKEAELDDIVIWRIDIWSAELDAAHADIEIDELHDELHNGDAALVIT